MTNYAKLIPDFGLTAEQLDDKYNPDGDGQHPEITKWEWVSAVRHDETLSGYWEWVQFQLTRAEDGLSNDNPCNPTGETK